MSIKTDIDIFDNSVDFDIGIRELEIFLNETESFFTERIKTLKYKND